MKQHGERPDGVMRPGGPTQSRLSQIIAPKLDYLVGSSSFAPKPYQPQSPGIVARTLKFRPTTIRTFERDPRTMPTKAEHDAAQGLLEAVGETLTEVIGFRTAQAAGPRTGGSKTEMTPPKFPSKQYTWREVWEEITNIFTDEMKEKNIEWEREMKAYRERYIDPQGINGRPRLDEGDAYSGNDTYGDPDGR